MLQFVRTTLRFVYNNFQIKEKCKFAYVPVFVKSNVTCLHYKLLIVKCPRSGLVRSGLVRSGLVRSGLVRSGLVRRI